MSKKRKSTSDGNSSSKNNKRQSSLSGFFASSSSSSTSSSHLPPSPSAQPAPKYKIFCDLDGVLVDFDHGVKSIFRGKSPDQIPVGMLWAGISRTPKFYQNLPWMNCGKTLWNSIVHLSPDILTGVPRAHKSRDEKFQWCRRELSTKSDDDDDEEEKKLVMNHVDMAGTKNRHEVVSGYRRGKANKNHSNVVNVITCWSRNKHCESGPNRVLIDDRLALKEKWMDKGGIFIHHTDAKTTIQKLKAHGILQEKEDGEEKIADDDGDDEVEVVEMEKVFVDERPDTP